MAENKKQGGDEISYIILTLFIGGLALILSPLVLLTIFFSYLAWASFNESEERKWIRSGLIALMGFMITSGAWISFRNAAPELLASFFNPSKTTKVLDVPLFKNAFWIYPILFAIGCYVFEQKTQPSLGFYGLIRRLTGFLFLPMIAIQMIGSFFIEITLGVLLGVKKIEKGSLLHFYSAILSALFCIGFSETSVKYAGKALGFGDFFMATAISYTLAYWYMVLAHGRDKEPSVENNLSKMKNNVGIHIGRIVHPKRMDLKLTWRDVNHHIHILGQPGVGKSVLLKNIYAYQILQGHGLLMVDLKADYKVREDFRALCREAGRDDDFILIDLSHPESSYGYNPLLLGNATELKDKIIGAMEWSEPYYKKVAERVLLTTLKGFVWIRENKKLIPTLEDLLTAIASVQGLTALAERVENESIRFDINEMAAGFSKDFYKDLESLRAELTLLTKAEFGSIFNSSYTLDIYSAIMNKKVVLVNLDGQTYNESAKKFGRLLLADLRSASGTIVTNNPEDQRPQFTVLVDEFADIVATEDMAKTFVGFLNRCRGSGIGVVIAHQSLGDFKDPTVRSQIMDSTETMFSFVQKDPETCEILAAIVGTREVYEKTKQTKEWIFGDDHTGMGTQKLVQEFIYHPNEFKNLGTGEAIYAAKKPSRFGKVHVRMIDIPQLDDQYSPQNRTNPLAAHQSLRLKQEISVRKDQYKAAIKRTEDSSEKLEI